MSEQPWVYGDPLTKYQEDMAVEEDPGKRLHTVLGVPALSDAAHDDDQGGDPAWLELVLGDVDISFWGGESVKDLIAIAETLQKLDELPVGPRGLALGGGLQIAGASRRDAGSCLLNNQSAALHTPHVDI